MSGYDYNSIVSRSEAEALKDMIFKRARERAEALNSNTQVKYTTSVQNDIMDIARDSFVASRNPFSMIVDTKKEEPAEQVEQEPKAEVGFKQRNTESVKTQIENKLRVAKEEITNNEITANMLETRKAFENKRSFMGALNFLNSQATIALINGNTKDRAFDAMA